MVDPYAEQALFGYKRGHDLLASSIDLDPDSLRLLKAATDVSTDGLQAPYLSTVLPIPKLRAQAFVRTWPAGSELRPGSVWAHVLLVDVVALGRMNDFSTIRHAFNRPRTPLNSELLIAYRTPIALRSSGRESPPNHPAIALDISAAVYATSDSVAVAESDLELADVALYETLTQQWPRLRRTFAFRTRVRPTETTWRVDVEVSTRRTAEPPPAEPWALRLAQDQISPDPTFRRFLWRYGAEAKRGRTDMPVMVQLFETLEAGDIEQAAALLVRRFPEPTDMRLLKREVFGPSSRFVREGGESRLVRTILRFAASFDLDALELGSRVVLLAQNDPAGLERVLEELNLASLPESAVSTLVESLALETASDVIVPIAASNPELGTLVVSLRPELLAYPELWNSEHQDLLADLFFASSRTDQSSIIAGLIAVSAAEPLAVLSARSPSLWWTLLQMVAATSGARGHAHRSELPSGLAEMLRTVLERIGAASVLAPPSKLSNDELSILLQVSDLSTGLWRRVDSSRWTRLAGSLKSLGWPPRVRDRVAAVALTAGASALSADARSLAWKTTFGYLHERLKSPSFDEQAWSLLSTFLPAAPAWDRCLRLRRGVISEVRRDRWPRSDSDLLISQSRGYERDMQDAIGHKSVPQQTWLEQILAKLTGLS